VLKSSQGFSDLRIGLLLKLENGLALSRSFFCPCIYIVRTLYEECTKNVRTLTVQNETGLNHLEPPSEPP